MVVFMLSLGGDCSYCMKDGVRGDVVMCSAGGV